MRAGLRLAGIAGIVLFLFGLVSYAFTGAFDLWTAVHVAAGGALVAAAILLNLARFRRSVSTRGTRERMQAGIGAALFAGLLVAANVFAARHPRTWDATEQKVHTLSDKTKAVLGSLGEPVEILAFFTTGDRAREPVASLLDRFRDSAAARLTWRFVDPERDPQIAEQCGVKQSGVLVARRGKASAQSAGDPNAGFTEGEVARLVLKAARPESKTVYVLAGHGEPAVDDLETPHGFGAFAAALAGETFLVKPLLLSALSKVPDDAAFVVVAAPRKALLAHEIDALRSYLSGGGRGLLLLDPGDDAGLAPVLADYRIAAGDDLIVDQEEIPFLGARLGLDPLVEDFTPHAVTRGFRERILLSQARSVTPRESGGVAGAEARVLARTHRASWAESAWREALKTGRVAKDAEDAPGPVSIAVAATAGEGKTRLVAIGDADLAENGWIGRYFNQEFLVNAAQWLAGSEELIAEPPKTLRASRLDMTDADYRSLFRFSVLLLPEVLLILGLAVWWRRRAL